jgi:hypothetical protein
MPARRTIVATFALRAAIIALVFGVATSCASSSRNPVIEANPELRERGPSSWTVKTAEHIDLWLHAFALIATDTTKVPLFRSDYRDEVAEAKRASGISTRLDTSIATLRERLSTNPSLMNAQFLGMYFGSWKETQEFMRYFLLAEGDPRRASNTSTARAISIIGGYFRSAADRKWAELFMDVLKDEYEKFFREWYRLELERRSDARAAADSLWQNVWYPKFRRYLDGSQQRRGDIFFTLPLGGEGRIIPGSATSPGGNYGYLAVNFPGSRLEAHNALFVVAHELSGRVVDIAVTDHTTPAEARLGLKARHESDGLVVGGYLLIKRLFPDLADDYARFYLAVSRDAGIVAPAPSDTVAMVPATTALEAELFRRFPLPRLIHESIARQIDVVLGGI